MGEGYSLPQQTTGLVRRSVVSSHRQPRLKWNLMRHTSYKYNEPAGAPGGRILRRFRAALLKRMSDDRQSWPSLSANKIGQQESVVSHAKIGRFRRPIKSSNFIVQYTFCIIYDIIGEFFAYRTTDFLYVTMVIVYSGI